MANIGEDRRGLAQRRALIGAFMGKSEQTASSQPIT